MFPVFTLSVFSCFPLSLQLRKDGVKLPNGNPLPTLFEFTELELSANPRLLSFLLPAGTSGGGAAAAGAVGSRAETLGAAGAGGAAPQPDTGADSQALKMGGHEA